MENEFVRITALEIDTVWYTNESNDLKKKLSLLGLFNQGKHYLKLKFREYLIDINVNQICSWQLRNIEVNSDPRDNETTPIIYIIMSNDKVYRMYPGEFENKIKSKLNNKIK